MEDTQFMTSSQKLKVLKQWERFLASGLSKEKFTKALYSHLIQHCSFIAHYSREGFYGTYFERGDSTVRFLSQFDNSNGVPKSIEYGMTYWIAGGNDVCQQYYDINNEMCRIAAKYIPVLVKQARASQRKHDIGLAQVLLAKHGIKVEIT